MTTAANDNTPNAASTLLVRQSSAYGPCLTLGRLTKTTAQFYCFDEWRGGDKFEGAKRVKRASTHVAPCPSCRDHAKTNYPHGYMD